MFHVIGGLFEAPALAALHEAVAALPYEDGRRTAGALARAVKRNAQAVAGPEREAVIARVQAALLASAAFQSIARPKVFARGLVSRYEGGQAYGSHVDDAIMGGARTDLSFTLFLSDPATYDGGELIVEDRVEDRAVKLPAGEMVLYPSDTLHRVAPAECRLAEMPIDDAQANEMRCRRGGARRWSRSAGSGHSMPMAGSTAAMVCSRCGAYGVEHRYMTVESSANDRKPCARPSDR